MKKLNLIFKNPIHKKKDCALDTRNSHNCKEKNKKSMELTHNTGKIEAIINRFCNKLQKSKKTREKEKKKYLEIVTS